jgi:hypothetical protein
MTIALAWAAVRRHPLSTMLTAILVALFARLLGMPVPAVLAAWMTLSLCGITIWHALEPVTLRLLGCRSPSWLERERLDRALGSTRLEVVILDAAEPWLGHGVRSLVVSRALLDLLEDRAVEGLLTQAAQEVRSARLAAELMVWLGNLPLVAGRVVAGWLVQLGRLLALVVGSSLVVPILIWPTGFIRWAGRLFGAIGVVLVGSALVSNGLAATGLGLLLGWPLGRGQRALLAWESRRAEHLADQATIDAGLGWQLLEALETLAFAESLAPPDGLLGVFCRRASPLNARADRVWRAVSRA